MAEHVKRKHARAKLVKMGYSVGGHLAHKADEAEDKEMVEEGVHEHESHMHKGKKKTKLKLKRGGHVEGEKPKHRADRLARGGKAKHHGGGKGHVTVNVVNAHPGGGAPRPDQERKDSCPQCRSPRPWTPRDSAARCRS